MSRVVSQPLSVEEFWALPEGEGKRELVYGEVVETVPGGIHGIIALKIGAKLLGWLESGHEGYAGVEVAFLLAQNPNLLRLPDVCYIAPEKLQGGIPEKYWETAPDLAVEVISPSETWEDIQDKVEEYLAAGSQMVWTVHPRSKRVVVHTADALARTYKGDERLEFPDLLPGFSCMVSELFKL